MDIGALITAGVTTLLVSRAVISEQKRLKLTDDPKKRVSPKNTHEYPVPRGGGLAIGIGVILALFVFGYSLVPTKFLIICIGLIMAVGYLDDRFQDKVSPYVRLLTNILIAIITWYGGIGIRYVTGLSGEVLFLEQGIGIAATVLWLTWMQNIVGWSSGVDGQLPGFVVIAALMVGVWGGFRSGFMAPAILPILALITTGAYLGFLGWNWYPQKIMPGYGGKSLAGYLLGVIAILADVKLGTMAMVLAVPFTDAVFAISKRLAEGRSPFWGGRDHLHYFLLDLGWSKKQVAIFYWLMSLAGGLLALRLKGNLGYFTMTTVILIFAGIVLWLRNWPTFLKPPDRDSGLKI